MPLAAKKPDLSLEDTGRALILTCKARRAPPGGEVPQSEAQLMNARAREYSALLAARPLSRVARMSGRSMLVPHQKFREGL